MPTTVNATSGKWLVQLSESTLATETTGYWSSFINRWLLLIVVSFRPDVRFICLLLTTGDTIVSAFSDIYLSCTPDRLLVYCAFYDDLSIFLSTTYSFVSSALYSLAGDLSTTFDLFLLLDF